MPTALLLYQYFHPDDVVSSAHLTELALGLTERGWDVTAMPANRSCRDKAICYSPRDTYQGITINRIRRPAFPQSTAWGRLANSCWMLAAWSLSSLTHKPDVVIIGTDPVMSASVAVFWKLIRPVSKTAHWCFDLYPEAAVAGGVLQSGITLSALRRIMKAGYQRFDLIADIGICMRRRIADYNSPAHTVTFTPWALAEPSAPLAIDLEERRAIFGDSKLALMYSGNFGRAHSCEEFISIARQMSHADARFAFSIRGNRSHDVHNAVTAADANITFAPFAPHNRLEARLSAADIHVVSLRPEWTGTVVPSKFFGALAAGRPVLFIGSQESYVAHLVREHRLGWVCSPGQESETAAKLTALTTSVSALRDLNLHCHRVYQNYFSRAAGIDSFDTELRALLKQPQKVHSSASA